MTTPSPTLYALIIRLIATHNGRFITQISDTLGRLLFILPHGRYQTKPRNLRITS